jgi:hypothetical protein
MNVLPRVSCRGKLGVCFDLCPEGLGKMIQNEALESVVSIGALPFDKLRIEM